MRRFVSVCAAGMLWLVTALPVHAADSSVTFYSGDGGSGLACQDYNWDTNFRTGFGDGVGQCAGNWNNDAESLAFHFHNLQTCFIFWDDNGYAGSSWWFGPEHEGFHELSATLDNRFEAFSKGVISGPNCVPLHP